MTTAATDWPLVETSMKAWKEWAAAASPCVHCQFGLVPVRLRRRWVHHFRDTGTIVVCEEKNISKPAS